MPGQRAIFSWCVRCGGFIFCCLLLNLSPAFRASAAGCTPAPAGLVGWWPGDGNVNSLVGTNTGVLQGGATATASGLIGPALGFDGLSGYVQIADAPVFHPTNLTIEAWVRFAWLDSVGSGTSPAGDQYIVFKQNSRQNGFEGFDLSKTRVGSNDVFRFKVHSSSGAAVELQSASVVSTGVWYHVAGIRGPAVVQLYVNGQLERASSVSFAQDYGTYPLFFGSSGQSSQDHKLAGTLDEVSLYNRALSASEIAVIYTAGASGKCKAVNITAQPQSQTVIVGGAANFAVAATGLAPVSYQWRFAQTSLPGQTSQTLSLSDVQPTNAGPYDVIVSNPLGAATSGVATLTVLVPPAITTQPQSLTNLTGTTADFAVSTTGTAPLFYQWHFNGAAIAGATGPGFTITRVQLSDAGAYSVVVSNSAGVVTSAAAALIVKVPAPPPFTNSVITRENQKPGTTAWQLTDPATQHEIEGYASLTSVNRGGQIALLVNTTNAAYVLEVYRIGWYSGAGGRLMYGPVTVPGNPQPVPPIDAVTGLIECNWTNPYTLNIPATPGDPADWASGAYLAKLTGGQDGKQSYIIFAVRDDARQADLLAQMSFTTYEAYNDWGGRSLYTSTRATKVSFNRPFAVPAVGGHPAWQGSGEFFAARSLAAWECNLVRWLEREGYDVSYCTSLDTHAITNLLWNHKGFISMGHDEYWSYPMRWNVEAGRDRGVNLAFLAGNECYWQVRFEPSTVDGALDRNMVCYKSLADPIFKTASNYLTTVEYRVYPVANWESSLLGVSYSGQGVFGDLVVNDASHWLFANTGLRAGQLLPGLLGYEVDATNRFSPPGVQVACLSPFMSNNVASPLPGFADAASYTAPSGATVFASGSMQWNWGLDDFNGGSLRDFYRNPVVMQMTRNLMSRLVNGEPPPPTLFFRTDASTRGNWKPNYGAEGYVLPNDSTNLPAYASVSVPQGGTTTYLATNSDPNCLQSGLSANRYLAGWSSPTNFTLDVNFSDSQNHQAALYFWDWNNAGRTQAVEVIDAPTGNLLDRRTVGGFTNGQWWVWQLAGHVQFRFSRLTGPDCVASALMLGSGGVAAFVSEDAVTQGNWKPYYGGDGGAYIAADSLYDPLTGYATIQIFADAVTNRDAASAEMRALQRFGAPDRLLAEWIGNSSITFLLNLKDNAWHQLALYCVDEDRLGRQQMVSLVDPANNAVLDSRLLANFGEGKYLVWNIRGALKLRIQRWGMGPATASGLFLGPPNLPPSVALTNPMNSDHFTLPTNIVLAANATDPDGSVRQVAFYADGLLLGSVPNSTLNSSYTFTWTNALVGQHQLAAVARDDRAAQTTSDAVTIVVAPPSDYLPPTVQVNTPADGSVYQAPASLAFSASVTYTSVPPIGVQFFLDGAPFGTPLTNAPFTLAAASPYAGTHSVRATVTDAFGVTATSPSNTFTILPANTGAVFREYDFAAQGNWKGLYGSEGCVLVASATNPPAYAAAWWTGGSNRTWSSSTTDPRALQSPEGPNRFAAARYSSTNLLLDVNLVDGNTHRIGLYCLDWDNLGGVQSIQVLDGASGAVLDARSLNSFNNGAYLVWDVVGHAQFRFTGSARPAVVSGVFFDPPREAPEVKLLSPADGASFNPPVPPGGIVMTALALCGMTNLDRVEFLADGFQLGSATNSTFNSQTLNSSYTFTWTNPPVGNHTLTARAVDGYGSNSLPASVSIAVESAAAAALFGFIDINRQGNWRGVFGQDGWLEAGDSTNLPAGLNLNFAAQLANWSEGATAPSALLRQAGPFRVAAAWYGYTNLVLDLKFTDTAFHSVALYFLDWGSQGGAETVTVLDPASGAVLDQPRTFPGSVIFPPSGSWGVWDVRGHVLMNLARADNKKVILSGVFFGRRSFLGASLLPDGTLQLSAFGPAGTPLRLEAATDLGAGALWMPLMTNTSLTNQFQFIVTDPTGYPRRFYRLITLP